MPQCQLSQEFLTYILKKKPVKTIHYSDKELQGFFLEYRPSGAGTWYFRYSYPKGVTHYYRIGNTQDMGAVVAREHAYRVRSVVKKGRDPQQEFIFLNKPLTLEEYIFEKYLPHIQLKKRSWKLDSRTLEKYMLPQFKNRELNSIKRIELVSWQNGLRSQGLKATTCNRILSVVKTLFSVAIEWGILEATHNPCKGLKPFSEGTPKTRYLNEDELRKVILELQTLGNDIRSLALQLLIFTGARKSEILTAQWKDVHYNERILTVPLSKSGKARHIPLSDKALHVLDCLKKKSTSSWLFPAQSGDKPITSLYMTWDKIRKKLKLDEVRVHDLRHSFASVLVNSGVSLYEVQKILGHYNPKVTMRYAHLSQSSLIEAANIMGKISMDKK